MSIGGGHPQDQRPDQWNQGGAAAMAAAPGHGVWKR